MTVSLEEFRESLLQLDIVMVAHGLTFATGRGHLRAELEASRIEEHHTAAEQCTSELGPLTLYMSPSARGNRRLAFW